MTKNSERNLTRDDERAALDELHPGARWDRLGGSRRFRVRRVSIRQCFVHV